MLDYDSNYFLHINENKIEKCLKKSIESTIESIALQIMLKNKLFPKENIQLIEYVDILQKFWRKANLGKFEYKNKTGKNIFRMEHDLGINGTVLFRIIFTKMG